MSDKAFHWTLWLLLAPLLMWSAVGPRDYFTWFLEILPILIISPALWTLYRRFYFCRLVCVLMWIHAAILIVGGHYTYAQVPFFNWLRDAYHLSRNHYDRLGHLAQGFVPAMIFRELLLRKSPLKRGPLLFVVVVSMCLAVSASYELFEWRVAVASGARSDDFLGTQGDPWDTQEDMACALIGAVTALLSLGRTHDRSMTKLPASA